jgi:hypothetical protein
VHELETRSDLTTDKWRFLLHLSEVIGLSDDDRKLLLKLTIEATKTAGNLKNSTTTTTTEVGHHLFNECKKLSDVTRLILLKTRLVVCTMS